MPSMMLISKTIPLRNRIVENTAEASRECDPLVRTPGHDPE